MTARLSEPFRWIAALAIVVALTAAGPALAGTPRHAVYSGTGVTSAGNKAKLKLRTSRARDGKVRVTIIKAVDGCFGASTEGSRARIRNGHFAIKFGGGTKTAGFAAQLNGRFSSARSATVTVHTAAWYVPIVGPPSVCDATSTIEIHKL